MRCPSIGRVSIGVGCLTGFIFLALTISFPRLGEAWGSRFLWSGDMLDRILSETFLIAVGTTVIFLGYARCTKLANETMIIVEHPAHAQILQIVYAGAWTTLTVSLAVLSDPVVVLGLLAFFMAPILIAITAVMCKAWEAIHMNERLRKIVERRAGAKATAPPSTGE